LSRPTPRRRARVAALGFLGLVLFASPLVRAFGGPGTVHGLPGAYLYLFGAWAVLILLLALAVEGPDADGDPDGGQGGGRGGDGS
jgi:hypothetical protein